ncbi:MAG TPA: GspMb/PilO family protein [Thermoanaerobaculia bacterium]|nr:GspMb/PilO family protein [Thermoanaerobaculia bacterium]
MIWREKRILLIVLGVLLLANTVFFFTYRVQYVSRLEDLDSLKEQTQGRLEQARHARITIQQQLAAYKKAQTDLQVLYNERWSTPAQRLTVLIDEVKKLAAASHLEPPSYQFTTGESKNSPIMANGGRGSIGTTTVEIAFTVAGTYEQVRRLINLLELSDQFVIIDGISLASNGSNDKTPGAGSDKILTLNIRLKTLFRDVRTPGASKQL